MRLKTQNDVTVCLDAIADVAKAGLCEGSGTTSGHCSQLCREQTLPARQAAPKHKCPDVSASVDLAVGSQARDRLAPAASVRSPADDGLTGHEEMGSRKISLPQVLFEPAPPLALRGRATLQLRNDEPKPRAVTKTFSSSSQTSRSRSESKCTNEADAIMGGSISLPYPLTGASDHVVMKGNLGRDVCKPIACKPKDSGDSATPKHSNSNS